MDRTMFRNVAMSAVLVAGLGLGGVALVNAPATSATASEAASAAADGTYEGTGKGIGGNVPVTVTVEGGKITAVEVGENSETQGIGTKAIEQLPAKIVEANGVEGVDAISGATVTSKAIFSAVEEALAGGEDGTASAAASSSADKSASSKADKSASAKADAAAGELKDGTYEGTGKGIGGDVPVTVTVSGGKITEVTVGDNSETQGIGTKAIEQLPAKIVEANGVEGVDAISGATVTSKAIFAAVEEALA